MTLKLLWVPTPPGSTRWVCVKRLDAPRWPTPTSGAIGVFGLTWAALLIRRANKLYADEPLGLDVNIAGQVYALDSSTVDLCLSLFDWAPFRSTKAAIKLHTLLDLRGCIPSFLHISDGKLGDVNVLDMLPIEAGAFYIMDRGYLDFARLYKLHQQGAFFVTRCPSQTSAHAGCIQPQSTRVRA